MALEKFANLAQSTLNTSINNSTTSVIVNDASSFPSVNFRIAIDREIMLVTGVSSNTFTVTRGAESSTATSHSSGAQVTHVVTAGALNQFRLDNIAQGTYASLPAAGQAGRIYATTDSDYILEDNGSAWKAYGPVKPCGLMKSSDYTWINQGAAVADFSKGSLSLYNNTSGQSHNIVYKAAPSTPYTVTIQLDIWPCLTGQFHGTNMMFIDTSSGKFTNLQIGAVIGSSFVLGWWTEKWTNATTFSAGYSSNQYPQNGGGMGWPRFMQLSDDGSTRYYRYSYDGDVFFTADTRGHTDFITPNAVGISIRVDGSDNAIKAIKVYSWIES
jgi:hypothetical protein